MANVLEGVHLVIHIKVALQLPSLYALLAIVVLPIAGVPSDAFGALSYTEARTAVEPGGVAAGGAAAVAAAADPRVTLAMQRPFAAGAACLERR